MFLFVISFSLPMRLEEIELRMIAELAEILAGLAALWFLVEKMVALCRSRCGR